MSNPIPSNIPEGTLWPDLDDGRRVRLEQYVALVDATYGRPFAALKDTEAARADAEPIGPVLCQCAACTLIRKKSTRS